MESITKLKEQNSGHYSGAWWDLKEKSSLNQFKATIQETQITLPGG